MFKKIAVSENGSWSRGLASRRMRRYEAAGGIEFEVNNWGLAFMWYRPERRFSVTIWVPGWSRNVRLWGPKKLSWEK